ncbi:MAG: DNA polymerase III subunit epsilon, partial [Pseudomonadota bacterium]
VDTLALARQLFPGAQASLDALCRRFDVDNSSRTTHGALLDSELLATVYLELRGGRQPGLVMEPEQNAPPTAKASSTAGPTFHREGRRIAPSAAEAAAHSALIDRIDQPLWRGVSSAQA